MYVRRMIMIVTRVANKISHLIKYSNSVKLVTEDWIDDKAKPYLNELISENDVICDTNIQITPDIRLRTASRERAIDRISMSKEYHSDNMLVIMNPYGYVPLSALAVFYTDKSYSVKVWVESSKDTLICGNLPAARHYRVPIMGLFAASKNYINIELYDGNKRVKRIGFIIETQDLPDEMKNMVKIVKKVAKPAFPFYYVSGVDSFFPYIFDSLGRIRYYITKPSRNYGVFPISSGMLLHSDRSILNPSFGVPHSTHIYEMDLWGRVSRTILAGNGMHHDMIEMSPGGNYLMATSSLNKYCEDVVAEVDRRTGRIVKSVEMDSIVTEPSVKDSADWAHLNTVSYYSRDNSVIVCLRNLHSVIKIDWETKKIKWLLGDPFFWTGTSMEKYLIKPVDKNIRWFYQAHASFQMDNEPRDSTDIAKIVIYDNHWQSRRQTDNFDNDENSYGVVYKVDEVKKTVTLYRSFKSLKSSVRSNVVYSADNNRMLLMSGCLNSKTEGCRAMIYDYKYSDGELLCKYGIKRMFYRAYPYEFDFKSLTEPAKYDNRKYGELNKPVIIDEIDTSSALELPSDGNSVNADNLVRTTPKVPQIKRIKSRAEKETEWEEMIKDKKWENLDHTERIKRTSFSIIENVLFMFGVDHIVSHLYMVSENNTYEMDYSKTRQDMIAVFHDFGYKMPVPVDNLLTGKYYLYVKCFGKLYKTGKYFTIKTQEESDE